MGDRTSSLGIISANLAVVAFSYSTWPICLSRICQLLLARLLARGSDRYPGSGVTENKKIIDRGVVNLPEHLL